MFNFPNVITTLTYFLFLHATGRKKITLFSFILEDMISFYLNRPQLCCAKEIRHEVLLQTMLKVNMGVIFVFFLFSMKKKICFLIDESVVTIHVLFFQLKKNIWARKSKLRNMISSQFPISWTFSFNKTNEKICYRWKKLVLMKTSHCCTTFIIRSDYDNNYKNAECIHKRNISIFILLHSKHKKQKKNISIKTESTLLSLRIRFINNNRDPEKKIE